MLTLEQIQEALSDRNLTRVSENTGLSVNTLSRFARGLVPDPKHSTMQTLSDYLEGKREQAPQSAGDDRA